MSASYAEVLLDAHVHYHAGFSRRTFFDAAAGNLRIGARNLGLGGPAAHGLLFTESRGVDAFGTFAEEAARGDHGDADNGWRFRETGEDNSLWAVLEGGPELLLVAGRQLVTGDGLEVLALGCRDQLTDGMPLRQARDAVIEQGGVPVVPWGFGKWWFSRGRLLAELIDATSPGRWFVGDNAGRPRLSRQPPLFARAARHDVFVLPGSDPLPLPGEDDKPGRCGFVMPGPLDRQRPAASVLDGLRACSRQPATFGRYAGVARFARAQLAMQMRKRGPGVGAEARS